MSGGVRRGLADLACRVLQATLPPSLRSWGWAVRYEAAGIPDDTKALLFALESLCGLMPRAVASHLSHYLAWLIGGGALRSSSSMTMNVYDATMRRPRTVGIVCAIGAVAMGIGYMGIAGAPARYLIINIGALVIGLAMLALLDRIVQAGRQWAGRAIVTMAAALLATALLGDDVDGATRWVRMGGLSIQPSLVLLPVMLIAFARCRSALSTTAMIATGAAMALQPDRAMAGMLAAGLIVLAIMRPDRHVVVALGASIAGLAITLARADGLAAVPYVDRILFSSFEVGPLAGAAVLTGSVLLLVPAIIGRGRDPGDRETYAVFGAVWLAGIMSAALGNYPTPLVGYGGSAIIGYVLSLLALPKLAATPAGAGPWTHGRAPATFFDRHLLVGLVGSTCPFPTHAT